MNDEIKEILEQLEWYRKIGKEDVYYPECVLPNKKAFILLDYITNLQQDLEKANDIIAKDRQFYKSRMDEYVELKKENERLKKDKRKAIEHIEEIWKSAEGGNIYVITIVGLIRADLLNILQNGSDEE